MTEEAKAARSAYMRKWAKEHPEKIREYARRHWEKKAAALKDEDSGKEVAEDEA